MLFIFDACERPGKEREVLQIAGAGRAPSQQLFRGTRNHNHQRKGNVGARPALRAEHSYNNRARIFRYV